LIEVRGGGSTGLTKNRKVRRVPINQKLLPYLAKLPRGNELVFNEPVQNGGGCPAGVIERIRLQARTGENPGDVVPLAGAEVGALNRERLRKTLKRLCKGLGFPDWQRCKLHTFRHAFASACAENNVPYRHALEWMGHHNSRILDLYIEVFDGAAGEQMQSLNFEGKGEKNEIKKAPE
jgi:integrase